RTRQAWLGGQDGRALRTAPAAGTPRTWLGPPHVSATSLSKSGPPAGRMDTWRDPGSLYRGSVWRGEAAIGKWRLAVRRNRFFATHKIGFAILALCQLPVVNGPWQFDVLPCHELS